MAAGRLIRILFPLGTWLFLQGAAVRAEPPPERVTAITVYGDDPCPKAEGDEIVVCAKRPESERYRIPKELREKERAASAPASWGSRVDGLEDASRAERPNSCSPVGSGGQSGCTQQMLRQWRAERRSRRQ